MIYKILVPVDGSKHSVKTLQLAFDLSQKYNADLMVINVRKSDLSAEMKYYSEIEYFDFSETDLDKVAKKLGHKIINKTIEESGLNAEIKTEVLLGDAARSISQYATENNYDTIIMGSRGLSDFKGLLLGSVSHKVNHMVNCTCINVR